ncbi:hypothetical protein B0A52_09290 [Exophiala mesophila]|uniref:Uncharacterized protein n=1 Tax=Exophiala mesophila TaxID=212818 RepID=A0A438MWH1_EXOME|nr:hypothetical protein B0A52_09290 [Exophiala mesophila]
MHLPTGYITEHHWSWSMSDPSFWSSSSNDWAIELDNEYLFPSKNKNDTGQFEHGRLSEEYLSLEPLSQELDHKSCDDDLTGPKNSSSSLAQVPSRDCAPQPSTGQISAPVSGASNARSRSRSQTKTQPPTQEQLKWSSGQRVMKEMTVDIGRNLQRAKQNRLARMESVESLEEGDGPDAADDGCGCTECESRRSKGHIGPWSSGTSLQSRINALSF